MYALSEEDRNWIRELVRAHGDEVLNTRNRTGKDSIEDAEQPTPEVYVALTPQTPIPGVGEEPGTGTGTGAPPTLQVPIYSGACKIARILFTGGTAFLQLLPFSKIVYNLSSAALGPGVWIPIWRDKFGNWYTGTGVGAGIGLTITKSVCEGDGNIHTWTFTNGDLTSAT